MKVIIIGCGRMGSGLAHALTKRGDKVVVVDTDASALDSLDPNLKIQKVQGVGFDKTILTLAGVHMADAVVACTTSDESNALIGRICQNYYKVPRVIARLYDPLKAEIYRSFGLQTISTTSWGVSRAVELLSYEKLDSVLSLGNADAEMIRIEAPDLAVGKSVHELTLVGEISLTAINRNSKILLPLSGTVVEKGDILFFMAYATSLSKLKSMLGIN